VGSGTTQVRRCRKDDDAVGSGRTMVSWAQERRRVHSVAGSRAAPSLRRTAVRCSTVTHDAQRCSALTCTTTSYSIPDTRHQVVSRPSSYRRGAVANGVHREGLLCSGGRRGHRAHLLEHIAPQLVTTTSMALRHIGNGGGVMERMQGVRDTEVLLQGS
jgi:hypothetical protein